MPKAHLPKKQIHRIAVIGAGMIGGTLGRLWMNAGHHINFGTRHPQRVSMPGATSGLPEEAAAQSDVILLAVPLGASPELARTLGDAAHGKLILDAGNVIAARDPYAASAIAEEGLGSGVWVARHFPASLVVKAFNTVFYKQLQSRAGDVSDPLGIPIAGDNPNALQLAAQLVADAGFEAVVMGDLVEARRFDAGTPLWNSGASAMAIRRLAGT